MIDRQCFIVDVRSEQYVLLCNEMIYAASRKKLEEKVLEIIKEKAKQFPKSKVEDYKIEYEDLLYLIVEGQSVLDLTKKVHKHMCKGWKTVGGVQLGEDSTRGGPNNKKFYFLQSLTRGSY